MRTAFFVWLCGYVAMLAFATYRLRVNAGFILNPSCPVAYLLMALRMVPWPYVALRYWLISRTPA